MRVGYVCLNTQFNGFKTMTVKKASSMTEQDKYNEIKNRTRKNFDNLYDIMRWNADNGIRLYRVSSNLCPLHTHDICNYDYREDDFIVSVCNKIKQMAIDNDIRLTIHPSQYTLLNSEKQEVFNNSIKDLEHHYDLCKLLGIERICLHVGGKAGGVEKSKDRFMEGWINTPDHIRQLIMLENCDKSYNVEDTLDLCQTLDIPMCLDLHHNYVKPSNTGVSEYIDDIINTWNGKTPIAHLSSSADNDKVISKHHDFIHQDDLNRFINITNGLFDCMFECKKKQEAIFKLGLA